MDKRNFFKTRTFLQVEIIVDLFLTRGSGTSSARNENLRPLLNTNKPLISGKYGLRSHF